MIGDWLSSMIVGGVGLKLSLATFIAEFWERVLDRPSLLIVPLLALLWARPVSTDRLPSSESEGPAWVKSGKARPRAEVLIA